MEHDDIDWLISNAPMDPFVLDDVNNWSGEIDWSLVDSSTLFDLPEMNCVEFPGTDKIPSHGVDIPWDELITIDPNVTTFDKPDSLFGPTEPSLCGDGDGDGTNIHKDIHELRQAVSEIQDHLAQLDSMYHEIKQESERSLSCILLLEDYAMKLMEWTSDFKIQVDKMKEKLDTYHME